MNNNILKKTGAFVGTLRGGKRRFSLLAGFASVLFAGSQLLTSCDLEISSNGNLDGFWHLVKVDTLQTGGVKDTSKDLIFWAFQLNLMKTGEYMARFDHSDGQLSLKEFCLYDNILGNEMLTEEDLSKIAPYGINALEETFQVEHLSSSNMTLNNGTLRLSFTKF